MYTTAQKEISTPPVMEESSTKETATATTATSTAKETTMAEPSPDSTSNWEPVLRGCRQHRYDYVHHVSKLRNEDYRKEKDLETSLRLKAMKKAAKQARAERTEKLAAQGITLRKSQSPSNNTFPSADRLRPRSVHVANANADTFALWQGEAEWVLNICDTAALMQLTKTGTMPPQYHHRILLSEGAAPALLACPVAPPVAAAAPVIPRFKKIVPVVDLENLSKRWLCLRGPRCSTAPNRSPGREGN
ncbi:hypothetical protein B0T24DRAFT_717936 [Lasiosphaeria ovina]|uniref:Uncharacterized protein n=1 Tax=Lasiosphaeria ovina TaxID=92902 RepID=A0AAE0NFL7_9PEZI|nr:hypothetical protein B0T24DRAFT_717936 [Lasiosphaeria ovina]